VRKNIAPNQPFFASIKISFLFFCKKIKSEPLSKRKTFPQNQSHQKKEIKKTP
jgi:hypothetical protein